MAVGAPAPHEAQGSEVIRQLESDLVVARQQIGQELHDGIGQQLVGLGLLASRLRRSLEERGAPEAERAAEVSSAIEELRVQVRALSKGLLPALVRPQDLVPALEDLALQHSRAPGVECRLVCDDSVQVPSSLTATFLYRIAQEAVSNAVEHGRARRVTMRLESRAGIVLTIVDDGVGMRDDRSSGSGIGIMEYRAQVLGGTLDIVSSRGRGTRITCTVPGGRPGAGRRRSGSVLTAKPASRGSR